VATKRLGQAPCANEFEAVIEIIEPMGAETYFYLKTGTHTVVGRSHVPVGQSELGARIRFRIDVQKIHFFDPDTTRSI
jgi:multiple sugar transport system ATP-binding protein